MICVNFSEGFMNKLWFTVTTNELPTKCWPDRGKRGFEASKFRDMSMDQRIKQINVKSKMAETSNQAK